MKDFGEAKEVLGIEINRNGPNRSLFLHQAKYTADIQERFGMKNCRPVSTPLEASSKSELKIFSGSSEPAIDVSDGQAVERIM